MDLPGCRTFFGFSRRDQTAVVVAALSDPRRLIASVQRVSTRQGVVKRRVERARDRRPSR
jgi:hypothetical protein